MGCEMCIIDVSSLYDVFVVRVCLCVCVRLCVCSFVSPLRSTLHLEFTYNVSVVLFLHLEFTYNVSVVLFLRCAALCLWNFIQNHYFDFD